jgi:hypothetical protein
VREALAAVVTREHDQRVSLEATLVQAIENAADPFVHAPHHARIGFR